MKPMYLSIAIVIFVFTISFTSVAQDADKRDDFNPPFLKLQNGGAAYIHIYQEKHEGQTEMSNSSLVERTEANPLFLVKLNTIGNLNAEVSIASNPNDPQNLVASWMRINLSTGIRSLAYAYSTDGGSTWRENNLSASGLFSTYDENDPVVIATDSNAFHIEFLGVKGNLLASAMLVESSTDGGRTFPKQSVVVKDSSASSMTGIINDKNWFVVDQTNSPYHGNMYSVWLRVSQSISTQGIVISRGSKDGTTWTSPTSVNDTTLFSSGSKITMLQGANIAIGTEGEVYVTWTQMMYVPSPPIKTIGYLRFDKSLDGGVTFGKDKLINSHVEVFERYNSASLYQRMHGFPSIAVDKSYGKHRGRIYICISTMDNGDADVFLFYSDNKGESWTGPIRVNDDPVKNGAQQFFGAVSVSPAGVVTIPYYDTRNAAGKVDLYYASSWDGGNTFISQKLSDQSFTPVSGGFMGDYIGNVSPDLFGFPTWAQLKTADAIDVLGTIRQLPTAVKNEIASSTDFALIGNYPNPVSKQGGTENSFTNIIYRTEKTRNVRLFVTDILGRTVATLMNEPVEQGVHTARFETATLVRGMYFYTLESENMRRVKKLLVVK